jgi:hypothetical protein
MTDKPSPRIRLPRPSAPRDPKAPPAITVPPVIARTTAGGGHPHGIITGTGPIADNALDEMTRRAERRTRELADAQAANPGNRHQHRGQWVFEMIGVTLAPGPDGWVAYGTLVSDHAWPSWE